MKEGWEYKKLGEVATYVNGFAFKPSDWTDNGLPIIRIQNLTNSTATFHRCNREDIPDKYKIKCGEILISWSATLGVYEWLGENALLNQHIFKVEFNKVNINKKYFEFAVKSSLSEMAKHTNGATMRHIRKGDFDNITIPVPSLSEQQRIVSYLDAAFAKIDAVAKNAEKSLNEAKALFQSALTKMMEPKEGWEYKKLGDVLNLKRGYDLTHSQMKEGQIVVAGSNGPIGLHNEATPISPCITIGRSGSVGAVNIYEKCWAHNTTLYVDDFKGNYPRYLYYILKTMNLSKLNSGSSIPTLNRNFIHPMKIPFIKDVLKQKEIIATIDSLKSKVDQLQSNLTHTLSECAALKQSILRETFE